MPILDPSFVHSLIYTYNTIESKFGKRFLPFFLYNASQNLQRNFDIIDATIQFKKDLKNGSTFLNSSYPLGPYFFLEKDFNDPTITNYYQFLYDELNVYFKRKSAPRNLCGIFRMYDQYQMRFFQAFVLYPDLHGWYFTTTPIAVLCINTYLFKNCDHIQEFFELVNIEIDLIEASGLTTVLCLELNKDLFISKNSDYNEKMADKFIYLLTNHQFSEIHFTLYSENASSGNSIDHFIEKIISCGENNMIRGYFYLYTSFNPDYSTSLSNLDALQKLPRFKVIKFSEHPNTCLKKYNCPYTLSFIYCINGFEFDKISIILQNVPLYDNEDDTTTSDISGINLAYISRHDYLAWNLKKVKVFFNDESNNRTIVSKYVNFDDIHIIKPDFYVNDPLYNIDIQSKTLETINSLFEKINNTDPNDCIFTINSHESNEEKIRFFLKNSSLAYTCFARESIKNFHIHKTQLFTAYQACNLFVFNNNTSNKGFIFQIDTGEGKSCIIQIIAATLALMGKTVHIASSNIILAKRDFENSFGFFERVGVKTSVLLHENELAFKDGYDQLSSNRKKIYPKEYYDKDVFKNSSNMNFDVCDEKKGTKIVFSTFVNFESYYLRMMELFPGYIGDYFKKCHLLIDEADSILIDELANGTILSHSIKSNAVDVLKYVYLNRKESPEKVLEHIQEEWPMCKDLTIHDVNEMFHQIDIVNLDEEFVDGKKYTVNTFKLKSTEKSISKFEQFIDDIDHLGDVLKDKIFALLEKTKNKIKAKIKKTKYEEKEKERIVLKHIVPFDYENKGVSEPNKEFSGFIQQFIAIKEMLNNEENKNMMIRELSMNYLYISHPIFVNLYGGVCGFTGTVGNELDISIINQQYNLTTTKIPRENPNYRVDYPIILCKDNDINERNKKIVSEIIAFNKKEYPVLVIFQNLNEIADVVKLLVDNDIKNINIFDGKDEKLRPDFIAGVKGAVSLGTNVCGRGTNITKPIKPLHVIIAYFTSNDRVLNQAFGRTARQGQKGSVRIICTENDFLSANIEINSNAILDDFSYKNKLQVQIIEKFRKRRQWIFDGTIDKQNISKDYISKMRESRININRSRACFYEYPICISAESFIDIQLQKIFSLYNCPNTIYTWLLFQKYVRELIFESFSLKIAKIDRDYHQLKIDMPYKDYLVKEINELYKLLKDYLPSKCDKKNYGIVPTFMHIYNKVRDKYEKTVLDVFPPILTKVYKQGFTDRFFSFTVGFKPFSLNNDSKVNTVDGENQDRNYISDPELKYYEKKPNQSPILLSITKKIDKIFDKMCEKINEVIGNFIGLKFFLRRTLGGCEFGVCYDFQLSNIDPDCNDYKFIVDKDPLFLLTVSIKSYAPLLAGVLIFGLVYLASVAKTIFELITPFAAGITKKIIVKTLKAVVENFIQEKLQEKVGDLFQKLEDFIIDKVKAQIDKIRDENTRVLFNLLVDIVTQNDFEKVGEKISEKFNGKKIIEIKQKQFTTDDLPFNKFCKLGILLLLALSSFLMNFHFFHHSLTYTEKVANEFDTEQNTEKSFDENQATVQINHILPSDGKNIYLNIKVIEAVDIPKMDKIGYCDPFVIIKCCSFTDQTKVIKNEKHPIWNFTCSRPIDVSDYDKNELINFEMFDWDSKKKKEIISVLSIQMNLLPTETTFTQWYDMIPRNKSNRGGKLKLRFRIAKDNVLPTDWDSAS